MFSRMAIVLDAFWKFVAATGVLHLIVFSATKVRDIEKADSAAQASQQGGIRHMSMPDASCSNAICAASPKITGLTQNIVGAAEAFLDLAKAFHVVSVVELPTDNGVRQSSKSVSIFVSLWH